MALSEDDVLDMVKRYDRGEGEAVPALATAFSVTDQTVRYHLKKRGVYKTDAQKIETDADLGIGEEDGPADNGAAITALMADPKFAKLIDAAVQARLASMGGVAAAAPMSRSEDFAAFTETLKHILSVQAMQQPGYIKPLPADEIDRRADGYVQMTALLKKYEQAGTAPEYVIGEGGFFECTNAMQFQPGSRIRTYLPPAESFQPQNSEAKAVFAAMLQWIGGPTPGIGEQLEAAQREAHQAPLVTGALQSMQRPSRVELIDGPRVDVSRKRVAGSIVPERRGSGIGEPTGPVFVGADAA